MWTNKRKPNSKGENLCRGAQVDALFKFLNVEYQEAYLKYATHGWQSFKLNIDKYKNFDQIKESNFSSIGNYVNLKFYFHYWWNKCRIYFMKKNNCPNLYVFLYDVCDEISLHVPELLVPTSNSCLYFNCLLICASTSALKRGGILRDPWDGAEVKLWPV